MKNIVAIILLSIFTLVQAGPAVSALFSLSTTVLIIDEDNSPEKTGAEVKKESKVYNHSGHELATMEGVITTAFHCSERLYPSPFLEIPGLPPDLI